MKRVYVQAELGHQQIMSMFDKRFDHFVTHTKEHADLLVFTGGADVNPQLYGCHKYKTTYFDEQRDARDLDLFRYGRSVNKPMVGICRGGQFLNVCMHGKLYQDVDNHGLAAPFTHKITDVATKKTYEVSSTHHQMMVPGQGAITMAFAECSVKRMYTPPLSTGKAGQNATIADFRNTSHDTEAVYYPKQKILCFQPHPEYNYGDTEEYFFDLLSRTIWRDKA